MRATPREFRRAPDATRTTVEAFGCKSPSSSPARPALSRWKRWQGASSGRQAYRDPAFGLKPACATNARDGGAALIFVSLGGDRCQTHGPTKHLPARLPVDGGVQIRWLASHSADTGLRHDERKGRRAPKPTPSDRCQGPSGLSVWWEGPLRGAPSSTTRRKCLTQLSEVLYWYAERGE